MTDETRVLRKLVSAARRLITKTLVALGVRAFVGLVSGAIEVFVRRHR